MPTHRTVEDWWHSRPRFVHPPGHLADPTLHLYTDGSYDSSRAAWAVYQPSTDRRLAARCWGTQDNYRTELCGIYAAL